MTHMRASEKVYVAAEVRVKKDKKRERVTNVTPEPAISCRKVIGRVRQIEDIDHFPMAFHRTAIVKGLFGDCEKT